MQKKPIIIISVLCAISLVFGYLSGLKEEDSISNGDAETDSKKEPEFLKEGLVAYYPFNGNAKDESGNGHDGIWSGKTNLIENKIKSLSEAAGFNGRNERITIEKSLDLISVNDVTASVWFKKTDKGYGPEIIIQGGKFGANSDSMGINGGGIHWYAHGQSGRADCPNCWSIRLKGRPVEEWIHIVGTWYKNADKVTATLFLNGEIIEEKRSGVLMHGRGNDLLLGSTHTTIGASTWGGSFCGNNR